MHGQAHIDKRRREALLMVRTGMVRVAFWSLVLSAFLLGLVWAPFSFMDKLFALVAFTASISTISLIETAWGQVAASKAQLAATEAHHDAESARRELTTDLAGIERDIARLAQLQPGPEATALADAIRHRLRP